MGPPELALFGQRTEVKDAHDRYVVKIATRRPGQILYRDEWQIVAKPEAATPTSWP